MTLQKGDKFIMPDFLHHVSNDRWSGTYINKTMKSWIGSEVEVILIDKRLTRIKKSGISYNFPIKLFDLIKHSSKKKISSDDLAAELTGVKSEKDKPKRVAKFKVGDFVYVEPNEVIERQYIDGVYVCVPMGNIYDQLCRVKKVIYKKHKGEEVPAYYLTIPENKNLESFCWPESVIYPDNPEYQYKVGDRVYVNQLITTATEENLKGMENFANLNGYIISRRVTGKDLRVEYAVDLGSKGRGWIILERYLSRGEAPKIDSEIEAQLKAMTMNSVAPVGSDKPEGLHALEAELKSKAKTEQLENEVERLNSALYETAKKVEEVKKTAAKTIFKKGDHVRVSQEFRCSGAILKQGAVYIVNFVNSGRLYLDAHPFYEGFPWQVVHINESSARDNLQIIPHIEFNNLNVFEVVKMQGSKTYTSAKPHFDASKVVEKMDMRDSVGKKIRTTSGIQGKITSANYDFIEERIILRIKTPEGDAFSIQANSIAEFISVENIVTKTEEQFALLNHMKKTSKEELITRYFQ